MATTQEIKDAVELNNSKQDNMHITMKSPKAYGSICVSGKLLDSTLLSWIKPSDWNDSDTFKEIIYVK